MTSPFVLIDVDRLRLFSALADVRRGLEAAPTALAPDGVAWRHTPVGPLHVGVTWLGPGYAFSDLSDDDPLGREVAASRAAMAAATPARHDRKFAARFRHLRFGEKLQRLAWAVHVAAVGRRTSSLVLADVALAGCVWGADRSGWPRHWRRDLLDLFRTLTWLHAADGDGDPVGRFGAGTVVLEYAADLTGCVEDVCPAGCPAAGARHHHFRVDLGPAYLGILEQFGRPIDATGVRAYEFPARGKKGDPAPTLRSVGKTGRLVSLFFPPLLGDPAKCSALTAAQRRLLQAFVREETRAAPAPGDRIPGYSGRDTVRCPGLAAGTEYVGFNGNGNGTRSGRGYLLTTAGGWLAKAGYPLDAVADFLADAAVLVERLEVVVVGVSPAGEVHSLRRLAALAATPPGRRDLAKVHVRAYAVAGYADRWAAAFDWPPAGPSPGSDPVADEVLVLLTEHGVTRKSLAAAMGVDASLLSKVLGGRKPWPAGWLDRARKAAGELCGVAGAAAAPAGHRTSPVPDTPAAAARDYLARGWSIVPQLPGAKQPLVKWKQFQTERPDEATLSEWWENWPSAGVALVLGPVSGVFVVDVDGPEAHAAFVAKLGSEPVAPKSRSGSGKPRRYHLFFRHPTFETKAKATPWHPKLEFRGKGGIVILPPSRHKSGRRYEWVEGRSPADLPLPVLPPAVLAALSAQPRPAPAKVAHGTATALPPELELAPSTRRFLSGVHAFGPNWNEKLFRAACDLAGRGVPVETAMPVLLAGAKPATAGDEQAVLATVASAYSKPRSPGRK